MGERSEARPGIRGASHQGPTRLGKKAERTPRDPKAKLGVTVRRLTRGRNQEVVEERDEEERLSDELLAGETEGRETKYEHRELKNGYRVGCSTGFLTQGEIEDGWWHDYESTYDLDPLGVPDICGEAGFEQRAEVDALIARMGGKKNLQAWLYQRFPRDTRAYVEPFGGSFKMLFGKPWRNRVEIINDIDGDLVHFYRMVREDPDRLVREINSLPTIEAIALGFREDLRYRRLDGLNRAVAFFYVMRTAFNAKVSASMGAYASSVHVPITTQIKRLDVLRVAKRLLGVDIRSTDFKRIILSANKEVRGRVLFYLDPPYDQTAGYEGAQGKHDFGFGQQVKLSELCFQIHKMGNRFVQTNSSTKRLKELYGSYKDASGNPAFRIYERKVYYSVSASTEGRRAETEFIISNYDLDECMVAHAPNKVKQRGLF